MSIKSITKEELVEAVKSSNSYREVAVKLNISTQTGHYNADVKSLMRKYGVDENTFLLYKGQGWSRGKSFYDVSEVFCENPKVSNGRIKQLLLLLKYKEPKCERCGNSSWMGVDLCLELHHINGVHTDSRLENLEILCPNCHSITPNYRNNNGEAVKKVSDEELIDAIKTTYNIKQALEKVGLAGKGGNYFRVRQLILTYNLAFVPRSVGKRLYDLKKKEETFIYNRVCPNCMDKFETTSASQIYCSVECARKSQMKFNPSKEELEQMIKSGMPMTKIGKHYGVSDKAVKKRLLKLGISP